MLQIVAMEETITVRVPSDLKRAVEQVCTVTGTTLTAVVRRALNDYIVPPARVVELPGLSQAFAEFLSRDELRNKWMGRCLILVDDPPYRSAYYGHMNVEASRRSGLVFMNAGGQDWIIPKKNVVAWYADDSNFTYLFPTLMRGGWHVVTSIA